MKLRFTTRELIVMSFLATMGITCKPLLSPVFNLLTDFIYIPGGSSVAGISMMFIVLGKRAVPRRGSATMMALVQGALAFCLGISSFQGLYIFVSYTLPGVMIDWVMDSRMSRLLPPAQLSSVACVAGVLTGATLTNLGFLRLPPVSLLLFWLVGVLSGAFGGWLADLVAERVLPYTSYHKRSNNNDQDEP